MSELNEKESYFNIACGYEEMVDPYNYNMNYLNCDEQYFSLNCHKKENDLDLNFKKLYECINKLQQIIVGIYGNSNVESIVYYHTDIGNESSLDEYESVNWELEEFAENFFTATKDNHGFTPTIKVAFTK